VKAGLADVGHGSLRKWRERAHLSAACARNLPASDDHHRTNAVRIALNEPCSRMCGFWPPANREQGAKKKLRHWPNSCPSRGKRGSVTPVLVPHCDGGGRAGVRVPVSHAGSPRRAFGKRRTSDAGSLFRAPLAVPECLLARNSISRVAGFNFLEALLVLRLTSLLVGTGGNEGGRSHLGSTWRGLLKRPGERIADRQTKETGDADTFHPRLKSRFAA
jgi:hypothetical protein